jgi:hypothetical protein
MRIASECGPIIERVVLPNGELEEARALCSTEVPGIGPADFRLLSQDAGLLGHLDRILCHLLRQRGVLRERLEQLTAAARRPTPEALEMALQRVWSLEPIAFQFTDLEPPEPLELMGQSIRQTLQARMRQIRQANADLQLLRQEVPAIQARVRAALMEGVLPARFDFGFSYQLLALLYQDRLSLEGLGSLERLADEGERLTALARGAPEVDRARSSTPLSVQMALLLIATAFSVWMLQIPPCTLKV